MNIRLKKEPAKNKMPTTNSDADNAAKIESLRKTISSAEKTIQSAKAMLLQLEGKKRAGRRKKIESGDGTVIYGTFDGQIMIGDDGKQYPVPANYASKSKLVEGDMLKLTIENGSFVYKQVGPVERKNLIGVAGQDESGNYFIIADGVPYKVLLASITYFKISPGDEVVITVPAEEKSSWAAIENVLQKDESNTDYSDQGAEYDGDEKEPIEFMDDEDGNDEKKGEEEEDSSNVESGKEKNKKREEQDDVVNEWMSDIETIKKEIQEEKVKAKSE